MKVNHVLLHGDRDGWDIGAIAPSGAAIELPGVPGTNDDIVVQCAIGEWGSAVRTDAVKRIEGTFDIADDKRAIAIVDLRHAPRRQFDCTAHSYPRHYV